MALSPRQRQLLEGDRWRALGSFITRWYAQPLASADGDSATDVALAEARLGRRLPEALAEWYELVGRRLRPCQDSPRLLAELSVTDGALSVWTENQGVWQVTCPLGGDDPRCDVDDDTYIRPDAPLSATLLGMLVSDTLVGAWAGHGVGPLGELAAAVRGGYLEEFSDAQVEALLAAYPPLPHPRNPYFSEPYRGADDTVVRIQEVAIEWMTASPAGYAALDRVLALTPEDGDHEVVARLVGLSPTQLAALSAPGDGAIQIPDFVPIQRMIGAAGHVGMAVGGASPRIHVRTKTPAGVLAALLAGLPADLLPHLTVATRPVAVTEFEVLYPPGRPRFVL
ncbi:MAG: hypothetical protein KA190_23355 [Kofleriaceae bacterium]|jgi:hypothetical protein|nr:hypothetical protein [Kofleriaceae bacterium]